LIFRFKDGSVDDETTVLSKRGNFQLITDHTYRKNLPSPSQWISIDVPTALEIYLFPQLSQLVLRILSIFTHSEKSLPRPAQD
jgi:hypothetical protein